MKDWQYSYNPQTNQFDYSESERNQSIKSTEVRIRPLRVGVCGSDIKQILSKDLDPEIGHEWVGIIEETGDNVDNFSVNEIVISLAHIACEKCEECLKQKYEQCNNRLLLGHQNKSVLSSSIILQVSDLLKVPQDLELNDISLFEVAFIGDSAYERAQSIGLNNQQNNCIVFGAGPIGIFTALSLKHRGFNVTIIEKRKNRLDIAKTVGLKSFHLAEAMIDNSHHNFYDAVFDCSGDNSGSGAINLLPNYVKTKGIVVIVGKYTKALIPEKVFAGKSLRLTWVANHEKNVFQNTIKFWSPIINQYTDVLTHTYDLVDINLAFEDAIKGKNLKNLIKVSNHESS